jgi:hypothetical protein
MNEEIFLYPDNPGQLKTTTIFLPLNFVFQSTLMGFFTISYNV